MRRFVFGSIVFSVCLVLSGCSGGSGDDGGGDGQNGNGDDCQGIQCLIPDVSNGDNDDPDAGNGDQNDSGSTGGDAGDPTEGKFVVGTCLDKSSPDSPSGGQTCTEQWQEPVDGVPNFKSQSRNAAQESCLNAGSENEWTTGEAVCPTGSEYIGTCAVTSSTSGAEGYVEAHYYKPDSKEDIETRCEGGEGKFFVE